MAIVLLAALVPVFGSDPTPAPTAASLGYCPFLYEIDEKFGASRCDEACHEDDTCGEDCYVDDWVASTCSELRCDPSSERLWLTKRYVDEMHRETSNMWWSWRTDACMVLDPDGRFYRASTSYEAYREEGWMDKGSWRDGTHVDASGIPGLNATDASIEAWGRRAYVACVEQCGGCDAMGTGGDDRVPAGLDSFFEAPYPIVDRPALDDAGCFSARALRGENWPFITTNHWVVICIMALIIVTPWVLGVCASRRCCPWYGQLQRARNEFADSCPCLARCLKVLCVSGCVCCSNCCGACCRRVRGCFCGWLRRPRKMSANVQPEEEEREDDAHEEQSDDVILLEPQPEDAPDARGKGGFRARRVSVASQVRLVLWKIWKTKSRSPSALSSQLVFPAAWFGVIWLLYVIMAKTFLPNHQWNGKHWSYDAKDGKMRDYEEGDILSHGLLELYLCQFAFVPLMQARHAAFLIENSLLRTRSLTSESHSRSRRRSSSPLSSSTAPSSSSR